MADEQDYETRITEEGGILRFVPRGKLEFGRSERFLTLVRNTARARGCRRVLIDARAFSDPMPNNDRFAIGERVAEEWRGLRVAVVSPVEARDGFIETVAVNRGATARGFESVERAMDWLSLE
ncbi:MAG TPA: hypothetical protein VI195_10200 [Steroidobacteraceae bacterium]|nr:hypothetical protein [Steroidobacteraceae bacterium]